MRARKPRHANFGFEIIDRFLFPANTVQAVEQFSPSLGLPR